MGRYFPEGEWDDLESMLACGRWEGRLRSSLRGKRTLRLLRELEAALLAMPEHKLAKEVIAHEGQVCALGAQRCYRMVQEEGIDWPTAIQRLSEDGFFGGNDLSAEFETVELGTDMGYTTEVAWMLGENNDSTPFHLRMNKRDETPEQCWARVLEMVRRLIRESPAAKKELASKG